MTLEVRWTSHALSQVGAAAEDLQDKNPEAAVELVNSLFNGADMLADQPELGQVWEPAAPRRVRRILVLPYFIYYTVRSESQAVFILAIRHARRAPAEPSDIPE